MEKCSATASKSGKSQFIIAYKDFWVYQQYMAEQHKIEKFNRERPFEYIYLTDHPYYLTTFYCAEMLYSVSSIEVDEDLFAEIGKEMETFEEPTLCSGEILIGRDVDSSEELAKRMLVELDNINDNAKKEIASGNETNSLADQTECVISTCSPNCQWIERQCPEYYCCSWDEEGNCDGQCERWVDCSYCQTRPCAGTVCPGDQPKKSQINFLYNKIKESNSEISSSYSDLVKLIQGNVDDEYLKLSKIFQILGVVQSQITACYNPKESYIKLEERKEGVIWREFFTCSSIKEFAIRETPFYDEEGEVIADCYGKTDENLDFMDNMFCCKSEYSPE